MTLLLRIFIGGGVGSVLRYAIGLLTSQWGYVGKFPLATFVCNILGCFLIGLFNAYAQKMQWDADMRLMLTVGLCGGFTTFSTFSNEGLAMLQSGNYGLYALYVALSIIGGLLAVMIGIHSV